MRDPGNPPFTPRRSFPLDALDPGRTLGDPRSQRGTQGSYSPALLGSRVEGQNRVRLPDTLGPDGEARDTGVKYRHVIPVT